MNFTYVTLFLRNGHMHTHMCCRYIFSVSFYVSFFISYFLTASAAMCLWGEVLFLEASFWCNFAWWAQRGASVFAAFFLSIVFFGEDKEYGFGCHQFAQKYDLNYALVCCIMLNYDPDPPEAYLILNLREASENPGLPHFLCGNWPLSGGVLEAGDTSTPLLAFFHCVWRLLKLSAKGVCFPD